MRMLSVCVATLVMLVGCAGESDVDEAASDAEKDGDEPMEEKVDETDATPAESVRSRKKKKKGKQ